METAERESSEADKFLEEHAWPQATWYWDQSASLEKRLAVWTWIGLALSLLATILAALPESLRKLLDFPETISWLVVVFSALATVVSGTLIPRYRSAAVSRELGRIKTTRVAKRAQVAMPTLKGQELHAFQLLTIDALMDIEEQHGVDKVGEDSVPKPK